MVRHSPVSCGALGVNIISTNEPRPRPVVSGYAFLDQAPSLGRTAQVFRGISLVDGSAVAIKVLTASVEQGAFLEEAFKRETEALAELRHPYIVGMKTSGIAALGERYIVLDWIESDLPRWKKSTTSFEWPTFWTSIGRPIASAVAHAHSREIYHRDLAPRNILVTSDGRPMVADFGIAKLRRFMRTDQTLRSFVSPPFTPPETDDGSGTAARDVFSLASLFCWCASPVDLNTYEEVYAFARNDGVFPPAVRDVLLDSLSSEPGDRPRVAEEFVDRLDAIAASSAPRSALSCQLMLGHARGDQIGRDFELRDKAAIEAAIIDDLHAACAIEPMQGRDNTAGNAFSDLMLYGLTRSYHVRPDEMSADRLIILGVRQRPSGWLEARREKAIAPRVEFRFSARGMDADRRSLALLQEIVDDHLQERELAENSVESRLFDTWSRILQAKQDIERDRARPIRYVAYGIEGRRVRFRVAGKIPDGVLFEKRQVRLADGTFLSGHIEEITEHEALFLVNGGDVAQLRSGDEIVVNVHAANEALRKQTRALDAFRERAVVRPHMADVLVDPTLAAPVNSRAPARYFQPDLDPDKQAAVEAALGSPDVLLLRGPPGTGKTTFIAELIMQVLAENPEARILLCSQTNVAIDNAIERVAELRAEAGQHFEVVRIGTNDERISETVEPFRLHRRLQAWTEEVSQRVAGYAEQKASERGVERSVVLIGMTLEQLISCEQDVRSTSAMIVAREMELETLTRDRKPNGNPRLDHDVVGNVEARRLELSQLRERRRGAMAQTAQLREQLRSLDEEHLASLDGPELDSALEMYLEGATAAEDIRPLIELGADWTARFGRQDHFEGPFISTVQVLAGTCLGVAGPRSYSELKYDLCIVDEASKATPTEMLVPLSRAAKWVLVGDSKQLPPFQDEAMRNDKLLREYELRREDVSESLFSYLEKALPAQNVVSLTTQRRMVKPINDLIKDCFYPDQDLDCARTGPTLKFPPLLKSMVTWVDTSGSPKKNETIPASGIGCFNRYECEVVNKLLRRLNRQFAKRDPERLKAQVDVAVITGYADQVKLLERTLQPRSTAWTHLNILLNTVDAFQGRQADMVVYSVARSNRSRDLGFLSKSPRLNVALSRGKDALVIVGDRPFCREATGENPFRDVIRWIERADAAVVEASE